MLDNNNTHNNTYTIIKENKIKINNFNIKEIKIKGVCWRNSENNIVREMSQFAYAKISKNREIWFARIYTRSSREIH